MLVFEYNEHEKYAEAFIYHVASRHALIIYQRERNTGKWGKATPMSLPHRRVHMIRSAYAKGYLISCLSFRGCYQPYQ